MVERILMGQRGSETGLWVSKPGSNVLTAAENDMMLSLNREVLQIVSGGVLSGMGTQATITFPNLGFQPFIWATNGRYQIGIEYLSNTQARLHRRTAHAVNGYPLFTPPNNTTYLVFSVPRG